MFPAGAPGIALVLLRAATCTGLFLSNPLGVFGGSPLIAHVGAWLGIALCALLLIGIASPLTAVLALLASLSGFLAPDETHGVALLSAFDAVALGLLGPGAYSLDARIFGRRLLVVARENPDDDDGLSR